MRKSKYYWFILLFWFSLCSYVLISFLSHPRSAGTGGETGVLFHLQMLVLTFPLGYFAGLIADFPFWFLSKLNIELSTATIYDGTIVCSWLMMVTIGFLQWFVWIPKLIVWLKQSFNRGKVE